MKIGIYSPYVESLSGGERYIFTLASHWSGSHRVSLFWDDPSILERAGKRFNLDVSRVTTTENIFKTGNVIRKIYTTSKYDLIFFLTDGSIPTTFAKLNILHFQVPFQSLPVNSFKLSRFNAIVCNSDFTRRHIDKRIGKKAQVIYPPVPAIVSKKKKKNIILSVGRFHPLKKQDVLIEVFRKANFSGYQLVLTGGLLESDQKYFDQLKDAVKNLPVRLIPNISYGMLSDLYREAVVYWHAAGFRESNPENMEHFGISTVEAMSAGAVPVVFNGGGLPEIVREGQDGYLWANTDELITKTKRIFEKERSILSKQAVTRSKMFLASRFTKAFDKLLTDIGK